MHERPIARLHLSGLLCCIQLKLPESIVQFFLSYRPNGNTKSRHPHLEQCIDLQRQVDSAEETLAAKPKRIKQLCRDLMIETKFSAFLGLIT